MRDPKRIYEVLEAVAQYWVLVPDQRLGQILWNLAERDPFYLEDEELIKKIKEKMGKSWKES